MIDTYSPTWQYIRQHVDANLSDALTLLEKVSVGKSETAYLRGSIAALRGVAELPSLLAKERQLKETSTMSTEY